jgi:hypothetical protein
LTQTQTPEPITKSVEAAAHDRVKYLLTIKRNKRSPSREIAAHNPRNAQSSIVARINRAKLGDFDAFILGSLLVSQYPGQVVIPDFGFYARDFYSSLIRQNRLAVGVNALTELDRKMQQMVLLMDDKAGRQCTFEDAETLAKYARLVPSTVAFSDFVHARM